MLMRDSRNAKRLVVSAWRDFAIWPRSARRTSIALVVLVGVFLPAACGADDPSPIDDVTTSTSTTLEQSTTTPELLTTTTPPTIQNPPATTAAPVTTAAPRTVTTSAPVPTTAASPSPSGASFANCSEAKAAGAAPISRGEPGYSSKLDRDGDGVACET
jgi:hypothetical protein